MAAVENGMAVPQRITHKIIIKLGISEIRGVYPELKAGTPIPIITLFTRAKMWKQPKCPLIDEGLSSLWYTYNDLLFSLEREGSSDPCCNTGEPCLTSYSVK